MTELTPSEVSADSKAIRELPIRERIGWLINHAHRHAMAYQSPDSFLARSLYVARHPTSIVSFKCMDGRMNLPVATGTPPGIITPFRNLGGRFDLGWPYFGEVLSDHIVDMVGQGRRTLALITYHYSKGDPHGSSGEILELSTVSSTDRDTLPTSLARLYPDMPDQVRLDLLPLGQGDIDHIGKIQYSSRSLDIEHHEWVIGIGRGFDWMYTPNLALITGPSRAASWPNLPPGSSMLNFPT